MNRDDWEKLVEKIRTHLANDGQVMIFTYTKATIYDKSHADWFKTSTHDGHPLVKRGRNWDSFAYAGVRFSTTTTKE